MKKMVSTGSPRSLSLGNIFKRGTAHEKELCRQAAAVHGQDQDADENVYLVVFPEVEEGIRADAIFDSKTLSAGLYWKLVR